MKRVFVENEVSFEGTYHRTTKSECRPKTVQPAAAVPIAAGGPPMLELAWREAEIVSIVPPDSGVRSPTPDEVTPAGVRRQIEVVRRARAHASIRSSSAALSM